MKTPKTKSPKSPKTPKAAKTVEGLIAQVHRVAKSGDYIFRGENKNYGEISSNLYRYFKTVAGQAELQKRVATSINFNPIKKILESQLKKQLGKDAKNIDFAVIEKTLKENISVQLAQTINYPLSIDSMQKNFILKDAQEYMDFENEVDTLAEVQHYGGSTNLIDFSHDLAVALFFACDGEHEENGRLILFNADAKGVRKPKKNQNNRIVFQKSIFVQRDKGYIEENKTKQFIIPKDLKLPLLAYVQNYFNIRTETIYGDLMGYTQNKERHSEAYKQFFTGLIYYNNEEFKEAIDCYTKAISIKPNFADAYNNRGNVKANLTPPDLEGAMDDYNNAIKLNPNYAGAYNNRGNTYNKKGDYNLAIVDLNKAIELDPDFSDAYNNRGSVYGKKDETDRAIADYDKAIELNPDFMEAYVNRGIAKKALKDYRGARQDFKTALRLDEQQKNVSLIIRILMERSDLPDDLDK